MDNSEKVKEGGGQHSLSRGGRGRGRGQRGGRSSRGRGDANDARVPEIGEPNPISKAGDRTKKQPVRVNRTSDTKPSADSEPSHNESGRAGRGGRGRGGSRKGRSVKDETKTLHNELKTEVGQPLGVDASTIQEDSHKNSQIHKNSNPSKGRNTKSKRSAQPPQKKNTEKIISESDVPECIHDIYAETVHDIPSSCDDPEALFSEIGPRIQETGQANVIEPHNSQVPTINKHLISESSADMFSPIVTMTVNNSTTSTLDVLTARVSQKSSDRPPVTILKKSSEKTTSISILKRLSHIDNKNEANTSLKKTLPEIVQAGEMENESLLVEKIALMSDVVVTTDVIADYVKPLVEAGNQRPRKSSSRLKLDTSPESKTNENKNYSDQSKQEVEEVEDILSKDVAVLSVTEALAALPAKEVSITASTSVRASPNVSRSSSAVNLINNAVAAVPNKSTSKKKKSKSTAPKKTKDSDKAKARAAMLFNRAVRDCVDNSDPDTMRSILRDPANKNYALDAIVLETVMKAYVMAAMFEDALYCLRHCALPGTLAAHQTERILTCLPQNLRNSSAFVAADMINALSIATEFDSAKKRTYFMRIVRGIALEFLEEATSARDRICSAPCERLIRSALCVVDAQFKRGKRPGELLVIPGNQLGVFIPEGNFMDNRGIQSGDAVSILPYSGPYPMSAESLDRNMIEATVSQTSPLVLKLQDKANASLIQMLIEPSPENVYRIDKLANRMGFNRQLSATVAVAGTLSEAEMGLKRKDQKRPCPELIHAITAMDENIDRMLLGAANGNYDSARFRGYAQHSTEAICSEAVPIWASNSEDEGESQESIRDKSRLLLDKYNALDNLNNSQKLAVEGAATNRLTLIQGPPGTGKTMVAIRILQYWATLASYEEGEGSPILATSDSNIAVDNLVEGCANAGLRVIRLGRPEAVRPELLRYCIDRPGASSSYNLSTMDTQDGTTPQADNFYGSPSSSLSASSYKEKMKKMKAAQVICCTCIGSGADILDSMSFERVLVDEATQATESAVLVPLTRGCRQLVLVGDHCQLPPTVLSTRAEEEGLGVPLFSRMVACGVPPFMLDTQYRMHPGIAMFPSDLFYGGKLLNGVSAPERRPLAGFPWPRMEFPVAFVPVNHGIEMDDGQSKYNEAEAAAACDAVAALLQGGQCTVTDIAVVTPYAAQVRLIRRLLRKLVQRPPYVEVSSVDGFQGREKEAVIFSAVRSNDYGAVGFVSDWRRVNVSFTRARRALIVLGNDHTLRRGDPDTWLPWLAWADAHGVNMDKPGVPRGRYDSEQLRRVRGGTTAAEMLKHVLERQQAQLKVAEQQLQKAERNAVGHIMGKTDEVVQAKEDVEEPSAFDALEDLAQLTNADGCWDDSDDDEFVTEIKARASSKPFATGSAEDKGAATSDDEPAPLIEDAWDL